MISPITRLMNTKIRTKLILMCIVVIVPVFLAGVYLLLNMVSVMRTNTVKEAFNDVENLRTRLNDTMFTVSKVADRVYMSSDINAFINNELSEKQQSPEAAVKDYLRAYSQIKDIIFFLDMDNIKFSSDYIKVTSEIKEEYWYKDIEKSSDERWQVIKNPKDEKYYLSLVRQVYSNNGSPVGAMVIFVSPEWLDGIMKDEQFSVIFTVQKGMIFYSNLSDYESGKIYASDNFVPQVGASSTLEIKSGALNEKGYTVATYFDYNNSGNLFQIYLIKPYEVVNEPTNNLTIGYVWYISMCFLLSILITILFTSFFARRIQFLRNQMHKVTLGDFNLEADIKGEDEINELYGDLQLMVKSMQDLINQAYKAKIEAETFKLNQMEADFKTLASQINPHFLYNTLETIRMKAYCNNDKETADLVKKLGKFMRRCLEVKNGMVTLESELEFTKSYLELQSARFGERVSYSIYCEVDTKYSILPLIIQPIVENAFIHGIESSKSNGHIDIKVFYKGDTVEIDVIDNGQGIPDDKLAELRWKLVENDTSSGKSIGLTNVNKRIKMYHGEIYGLSVTSDVGKGTRITVALPRNSSSTMIAPKVLMTEKNK